MNQQIKILIITNDVELIFKKILEQFINYKCSIYHHGAIIITKIFYIQIIYPYPFETLRGYRCDILYYDYNEIKPQTFINALIPIIATTNKIIFSKKVSEDVKKNLIFL